MGSAAAIAGLPRYLGLVSEWGEQRRGVYTQWTYDAGRVVKVVEWYLRSNGSGSSVTQPDKEQIVDPSEHAMDIIDFATHPRRPIRIWNASSVIAVASKGVAHFLNYGGGPNGVSRRDRREIQARIQGQYKTATLIRPDGPPINLEAKTRGTTTEVFVPELTRVGTVLFR